MQLLVTGAGGLLGSNLVATALSRGWEVVQTYHTTPPDLDATSHRLDVRNVDDFERLVAATSSDAVVNAAAVTDVDECEKHPELARAVNARAPARMAAICDRQGVRIVHVSTDYVFDGRTDTAYDESAASGPIQVYGETKLAGERGVRAQCDAALVPRLSFVYGVHRGRDELTGFPAWVAGRLQDGRKTPLFTDQHVTPSRAGYAASTILTLVAAGAAGTYNVACRSCVTPFELGIAVGERLDAPATLIDRGSRADLDRAALRPARTCLDVSKLAGRLDADPPTLAEDLDAVSDWL